MDENEEMLYCMKCRNPLLYVIRERREKYRKLPMKGENLQAIETIHTFICPECGHMVGDVWHEEKIELREKIDLTCAICGKTFQDYPAEGWIPICHDCYEKHAWREESDASDEGNLS